MTSSLLRRYPHLLAGSLCAGLAAANAVRSGSAWVAVLAAAAVVVAALQRELRSQLPLLALGLALAGWWWGSVRLDAIDRSVLLPHVGETAPVRVVVTGPARRGRFSLRIPARVERLGRLALDEAVLLQLPLGRSPPQGAILELIGRLKRPRGPSDGFDERKWLRRHGVHVVVRGERWRVVGHRGGLGGYADSVRAWLARSIAPGLRGERRAVLAGVVLGEDEGLSEELRARFRASGLYHLLAVSGQNVAFIAGGVLLLAWLLGLPRWLGELGALAGIGSYVLAVGAQPSVIRAGIAGALTSLAWLTSRQRDRWHFLLLGALVLLAWSPYNLLDPGFQLSFAAVAAIFVAVPRFERALEGYPLPRAIADVAGVSLACGAATAPVLWLQFGAVPVYTVLSNMLAASVVAPLLGLAFAAAAVSSFAPGFAGMLGWASGWLAAYLAACARLIGGLPFATVRSGAGIAALVTAIAFAALAVRLRGGRRRLLLATALVLAIGLGAWRLWPRPLPPPPQGLRISFLDVGQGDAALLEVPGGAVLVDEGPPEADVAGQLRRLGVRRLAAVVLTHPQRDHVGGAARVLAKLPAELVLDPGIRTESSDERAALAEARRRRVRVIRVRAGQTFELGRLRLRVLWPDGPGLAGQDPNDHAIVLLASYGETDALLTADAESDVTLPLQPPEVEVLKVAHHGSSDPGLAGLLARIRPRVAVISVGARNDYGHPTPSTLATLAGFPGLAVYRTDLDGRVVVESDGRRIQVREQR